MEKHITLPLTEELADTLHAGDTVYLTMTPAAKRLSKKPGRGVITYQISILNQRDEVVMDGVWVILMATDREHME